MGAVACAGRSLQLRLARRRRTLSGLENVPRAERRRFRAILHDCQQHGLAAAARGHDDFPAYLAGYAAYVHMVDPVLGQRWIDEVKRLLAGPHA